MSEKQKPLDLDEIREYCGKATPGPWTLNQLDSGLPESIDGYECGPRYFRYVDGEQKFFPAYDVPEVETLGNHECGAMELPNATFVFRARTDLPSLVDELQAARERIAGPPVKIERKHNLGKCECGETAFTSFKYCPRCGAKLEWI